MPVYTSTTQFWIYKSNWNSIEQIQKYNHGIKTRNNSNPQCSDFDDKYLKVKTNNIFCFTTPTSNINIKSGDIVLIFNNMLRIKILI